MIKLSKGITFFLGAVCTGAAVGLLNQDAYGFATTFLILGIGMLISSMVSFMMDGGK